MANADLFVYGTLRRGASHPMSRMLAGRVRLLGRASWQGRLFLVGEYPGAVPSDEPQDIVHGEVYRLADPERLLAELDVYEGCSVALPAAAEYERRPTRVSLAGGGSLAVWIYVYQKPTGGLQQIVSGDFLRESEYRS
ncbi:MAG TPA: gamma-glutamylcyclotransferase family protein [Desulfuromonadales bacterium]|nr:gamma-glutamylcyclotransferase family protein [Desulfuromonadales bacterium]